MQIGPQSQVIDRAVCFDFDKTMTNGHWHQALAEAGIPPGNGAAYIDALMKGLAISSSERTLQPAGLKNPRELSLSMKRTLDKGVGVAIVSFTRYPEVIKPVLSQLTQYAAQGGLTPEDIDKIYIRGGFPSDNNPNRTPMGKKEHLLDVMQHFRITRKENLVLVDDSARNCLICRGINPGDCAAIDPEAIGFQAIEVPVYPDPSLDYLERINTFVAPYTPAEAERMQQLAEETDFLETLTFVTDKLERLNMTMSSHSFNSKNDPVATIVQTLQDINSASIPVSEKREALQNCLTQYEDSDRSDRASLRLKRMVQTVKAELRERDSAKTSSTSRLRF